MAPNKRLDSKAKQFIRRYTHHKSAAQDLEQLLSEAFTDGYVEGQNSFVEGQKKKSETVVEFNLSTLEELDPSLNEE